MEISEDGRVAGSVDRAKLAELYQGTDDAELKAHYEEVDPGIKDYVDSLTAEEEFPAEEAAEESPSEDLSSLSKAELIDKAAAAGIDTEGKTKADLVAEMGG